MLTILPCLDSADRAAARRRELDVPRGQAAFLGRSALEAAATGFYIDHEGRRVDWSTLVEVARANKCSIPPDAPLPGEAICKVDSTRVQVANETTLGAAYRLVGAGLQPLALNFANGVQPGGGFIGGARAQEEVLCRSSALYATLTGDRMYAAHREQPLTDTTDWAILSPAVPVFRRDDGAALAEPWTCAFLTCAAPYAPSVGQPLAGDLLRRRIHRVLAIAQAFGYRAMILGAWGCGAFGNDPARTARDFREALVGRFDGVFVEVVFAVTDWSAERRFLGPFREVFSTR